MKTVGELKAMLSQVTVRQRIDGPAREEMEDLTVRAAGHIERRGWDLAVCGSRSVSACYAWIALDKFPEALDLFYLDFDALKLLAECGNEAAILLLPYRWYEEQAGR